MLSTIGFIAVLLIVFTVGFVVGRKPLEPIKIDVKFEEFAVEDLELCRNIMKSVADCIDDALEDAEVTKEEESESGTVSSSDGSETAEGEDGQDE